MCRLLYWLKRFIRRHPSLYFLIAGHRESVRRLRARKDSELVVEAFPRSANTTSMYALYYAQGKSFRVGHHLHVAAHVVYAVKRNIPCLVIVRQPLDCIASLMVMRKGGDAGEYLRDYIDFSRVVLKLRQYLVVVDFDSVVSSGMGAAVNQLSHKYGTAFREPSNSAEEVEWVQAQIRDWNAKYSGGDVEKLSFPTDEKKAKAEQHKQAIRGHGQLLAVAEKLYSSLSNLPE